MQIGAPGVKLINMIIHDTRGGPGLFAGAVNAEAYGCIIYNNGWNAPDRGHGHGLYVQNLNGLMHLSDNIIFNQFGLGIHGYTEGAVRSSISWWNATSCLTMAALQPIPTGTSKNKSCLGAALPFKT